jgi:hypothetical protein
MGVERVTRRLRLYSSARKISTLVTQQLKSIECVQARERKEQASCLKQNLHSTSRKK